MIKTALKTAITKLLLFASVMSAMLCLMPDVCVAQDTGKQNVPTLRTQSNVVFVPTLVTDKHGKLVFGLKASDFIIEDDGVPQQINMDDDGGSFARHGRRRRLGRGRDL